MPSEAQNLPDEVKTQLLSRMRARMGDSAFFKLADLLGEDEMIETALYQERKAIAEGQRKQRWLWAAIVGIVLLVGIGVRAQTWGQFLIFGAAGLGAASTWAYLIVAIPGALKAAKGCEDLFLPALQTFFFLPVAIITSLAVGYFVISGDFEAAQQFLCGSRWLHCKTPTPTPTP
jgi:hypothetical protein